MPESYEIPQERAKRALFSHDIRANGIYNGCLEY
jgi:hypothetical protein